MKTSIKVITLFFAVMTAGTISAQQPSSALRNAIDPANTGSLKLPSWDVFGVIPDPKISHCGWGFGFNVMSKPFALGIKENKDHIEMRLGGGFYFANLWRSKLSNVPLDAPQTGDATVNLYNTMFGLNGIARFSLPYSNRFIPYVDVFGGMRIFGATMDITPNHYDNGYKKTTSNSISSFSSFNYGATGGVMYSINKYVKFNTGVMLSYSQNTGQIANMDKVHMESNTVVYDNFQLPKKCVMVLVGFTFLLDTDNSSGSSGRRSYGGSGFRSGGFGGGGSSSHISIGSRPSR